MSPAVARKWTCAGCGVASSRADSKMVPLPEAWEACGDGTFCLGCRRQRVAEAALDSAPAEMDRDSRARLRRSAVVDFEVLRVPERTNGAIAKSCRSSISAVAAARQRVGERASHRR